ncbi:hypothetical protein CAUPRSCDRAFT_11508 [Caulochytrium protostelioides]|uniref:Uncharacterized protein n=1 Tax=Caulochytrium protostelioides TaxID=1555241 RepID=A0A4P9WU36_9FUNG|nr:hypothetical protein CAUPRSCDRAFT_11508 [Caulochytrium protostelioides]
MQTCRQPRWLSWLLMSALLAMTVSQITVSAAHSTKETSDAAPTMEKDGDATNYAQPSETNQDAYDVASTVRDHHGNHHPHYGSGDFTMTGAPPDPTPTPEAYATTPRLGESTVSVAPTAAASVSSVSAPALLGPNALLDGFAFLRPPATPPPMPWVLPPLRRQKEPRGHPNYLDDDDDIEGDQHWMEVTRRRIQRGLRMGLQQHSGTRRHDSESAPLAADSNTKSKQADVPSKRNPSNDRRRRLFLLRN